MNMLQSLSPYALLCASKPKVPPSITTDYDHYSILQTIHTEQSASAPASSASEPRKQPRISAPVQRTHYIGDIHARHANAIRQTPQNTGSL